MTEPVDTSRNRLQSPARMGFLRHSFIRFLLGMVMFSLFGGDLVADAMHDAFGDSPTEEARHHSKDADHCPSCTCAVHSGAVVVSMEAVSLGAPREVRFSFTKFDAHAPLGVPVSIDHPPQLA